MKHITLSGLTALALVLAACGDESASDVQDKAKDAAAEVTDKAASTEAEMKAAIRKEVMESDPSKTIQSSTTFKSDGTKTVEIKPLDIEIKEMEPLEVKPMTPAEKFMADNASKTGVVTTSSGLQYKALESGDGATPTRDNTVKVHYEGKLIDGTVFDSSYKRGQPIEFGVTQVIAGWTEALQLMQIGDVWEVYIPPELGYGARGAGDAVPPNAAMIFKVELLGVR